MKACFRVKEINQIGKYEAVQTFYSANILVAPPPDLRSHHAVVTSKPEPAFGLDRIEIYVTRFQFSFQRSDIRLKYITTDAMLEMLPWKPALKTGHSDF